MAPRVCVQRPALTGGVADPHERRTGVAHDHLHVGEVGVDQPGRRDEVGDALHTLEEDLVGHLERVEHRRLVVRHGDEPVVRDDDEGVDLLLETDDPLLGLDRAAPSLEGEGSGDHADGEGAEALGDLRHHGGATSAGATPLTRRDEDHVGALEHLLDLFPVLLGGLLADLGVRPGAEATGELTADVELHVGVAHEQRLGIRVDGDELDALEPRVDHSVDGVDATATDAHHLDDREVVLRVADHGSGTFLDERWGGAPRAPCRAPL